MVRNRMLRILTLVLAAALLLPAFALAEMETGPEIPAEAPEPDLEEAVVLAEAVDEAIEPQEDVALEPDPDAPVENEADEAQVLEPEPNAGSIRVSARFSATRARYGETVSASWTITGAAKPYLDFHAFWVLEPEEDIDYYIEDCTVAWTDDADAGHLDYVPMRGEALHFYVYVMDANGREFCSDEDEYYEAVELGSVELERAWADQTIEMVKSAKASTHLGQSAQIVCGVEGLGISKCTSGSPKVAAVTRAGLITPKKAGTAKITVVLTNKKKWTLTLKVVDPRAATAIHFEHGDEIFTKMYMYVGQELFLQEHVGVYPVGVKTRLTFSSSKKNIVKAWKDGAVLAKKPGKSVITVKTSNGKKAKVTVVVQKNRKSGIHAKPTAAYARALGNRVELVLKSVEETSPGKMAVEFYVVNGWAKKLTKIRNLHVFIEVPPMEDVKDDIEVVPVDGTVQSVSLSVKPRSVGTVKLTFSGDSVGASGVPIFNYSEDEFICACDLPNATFCFGKFTTRGTW